MPNEVSMRHAEHEQAGHRDRDGEGGEHHGRAGRGDGLDDGVVERRVRGRAPRGTG